jgi:hypothetical protein
MQLLSVLFPLISLVCFATFIWLVVVAFRHSALWGVLVLLFSPLTAIIFAIQNWQESKKPFLFYMGSTAAMIAIFFAFFLTLGVPMLQMAKQLNEGDVSEAEMNAFMDQQIERMEDSGLLSEADAAKLRETQAQMQVTVHETDGDMDADALNAALDRADSLPQREPPRTAPAPEPESTITASAVSTTRIRTNRDVIPLRDIDSHVGKKMRITMKDGSEYVGRYVDQADGELRFERRISSGSIDVHITKADIRSIHRVK